MVDDPTNRSDPHKKYVNRKIIKTSEQMRNVLLKDDFQFPEIDEDLEPKNWDEVKQDEEQNTEKNQGFPSLFLLSNCLFHFDYSSQILILL